MNTPEQIAETATKLTQSILQSLGFSCTIQTTWDGGEEIQLMITSPDSRFIIGENGSRLDDLQYLLNRLIVLQEPEAPRLRVDCDRYRERSEAKLLQSVKSKAERVLASGKSTLTQPLNAYHRRLVHSALAKMPGIKTESEAIEARFKRITISRADS
ncbi:MAG: hypothetical protein J1E42_05160 [Akkermansiaceae bacterium]|nr:hypothetical protein [Akkermansiaceae bacterium]